METKREFTISITCSEGGEITIVDSRNLESSQSRGKGVIVCLGDESTCQFNIFAWGHYRSIVHGFYSAIMWARNQKTDEGEHYRHVLGMISRMILQLYDYFRSAKELSPEEVLAKWEMEDAKEKNEKEVTH